MKRFMILSFLLSFSLIIQAQNSNVNDEISSLKKQTASLMSKNATLEQRITELKHFSKTSLDTLISQLKENNLQLMALKDSLTVKDKEIKALHSRSILFFHSLNLRKKMLYIFLPIGIIILVLLFWQLHRKIATVATNGEKMSMNVKTSLEEEVQAVKNELANVKESLEKKIADHKIIVLNTAGFIFPAVFILMSYNHIKQMNPADIFYVHWLIRYPFVLLQHKYDDCFCLR